MTATIATLITLLIVLLGAGVWVSLGLFSVGIGGLEIFRDMPIERQLSISIWNTVTSESLIALPLFILMAEVLFRTRLSASLFNGLAPWVANLPGGLMHVNVLGCTMFAAISGSSAATAATVGRITLFELFSRGYDRTVAMGSLAGAGTLGFLIPPSVIMIIYGVLSGTSVLKLFIAGVVPGLLLALSYMGYIAARAVISPSLVPRERPIVSWEERVKSIFDLGPVAFLILLVLGSMYGGLASPTEAAAVGVFGSFVVRRLPTLAHLGEGSRCLHERRANDLHGGAHRGGSGVPVPGDGLSGRASGGGGADRGPRALCLRAGGAAARLLHDPRLCARGDVRYRHDATYHAATCPRGRIRQDLVRGISGPGS